MAIASGVKFRCYPTPSQQDILSRWIGCQRFIYNAKATEDRYFRTFRNHSLNFTGVATPVDQQYSQFKDKELTPFLYDVPSQILRNGATRFMQAYQRFFKGLAGRPTFKRKNDRQTVWVTNELFTFEDGKLHLGTKSQPIGQLKFKAHAAYAIPASLTISRHGGKWFISFTQEIPGTEATEADLIDHFSSMTKQELEDVTVGLDRGVVIPLKASDDMDYGFSEIQKKRLQKNEQRRKKLQKKKATQEKGSNRTKHTAQKISRLYIYSGNVRNDFAHKTSHSLVASDAQVFVYENLKIRNMTKAPKPKQDENGRYLKNKAQAKAGLNKSILESTWGKTKQFTSYKAARKNKLTICIIPNGTSQECSRCGHTHPDNRISQSEFVCVSCGLAINADLNAALVIKERGITSLLKGEIVANKAKRAMRMKGKAPLGRGPAESTRGETEIRRQAGRARRAQLSVNRETSGLLAGDGRVVGASLMPRQLAAG